MAKPSTQQIREQVNQLDAHFNETRGKGKTKLNTMEWKLRMFALGAKCALEWITSQMDGAGGMHPMRSMSLLKAYEDADEKQAKVVRIHAKRSGPKGRFRNLSRNRKNTS